VIVVALLCAATSVLAPAADARELFQAIAPPHAILAAAFRPDELGAPTTVSFQVRISSELESVPSPVSSVELSYPTDLGLATSGLGLESCNPAALLFEGDASCPADSKMGQGSALVEVPFGPETVSERIALGIYAAPSNDGYLHLAILARGKFPVLAQIVLAGVMRPGRLQITVPPIVSLPGAPYASIADLRATLGGRLTYFERVRGRLVAYRPKGIGLPGSCPSGGWRLGASFSFIDGTGSDAATAIPCPDRH
jgi:hypothetical protein